MGPYNAVIETIGEANKTRKKKIRFDNAREYMESTYGFDYLNPDTDYLGPVDTVYDFAKWMEAVRGVRINKKAIERMVLRIDSGEES